MYEVFLSPDENEVYNENVANLLDSDYDHLLPDCELMFITIQDEDDINEIVAHLDALTEEHVYDYELPYYTMDAKQSILKRLEGLEF